LRDDRHPLRHGADRGAAVGPRVELGAPGHVRPAAHRPSGAPRAPPHAAAVPERRPEAPLRPPGRRGARRPSHGDHPGGGPRLRRRRRDRRRVLDRGAVLDPAPRQPRVRARARGGRAPPPGRADLRHRRAPSAGRPRRPPRNRAGARGGASREGGGARRDEPPLPRARKETIMNYADYRHLTFDRKPHGVLLITINRPEVMNATNARLHWELTQVWLTVDADPEVRVALVTGAGKAFSAGGDLSLVEKMAGNPDAAARTMREASDLVYNMIN